MRKQWKHHGTDRDFHIQDQLGFGTGAGKPALITHYMSNGTMTLRGESVRGESIENARSGDH
jgi:hypothetical protein